MDDHFCWETAYWHVVPGLSVVELMFCLLLVGGCPADQATPALLTNLLVCLVDLATPGMPADQSCMCLLRGVRLVLNLSLSSRFVRLAVHWYQACPVGHVWRDGARHGRYASCITCDKGLTPNMRKRAPWQLHSSWPTSSRQRLVTGPGMIDTQAYRPSMVEQGRAAGIQLGLTCEDLVALGLQPSASLLTSGAVTDGQCNGAQWPNAQLADRADAPRIAYSTRARPLHTPLDEETKENLLLELASDVHARSSVASQQSLLSTWTRLHVRWFGSNSTPFPTWPLAVRAIASQMKLACYRSIGNYLSRAKREHINAGGTWNQLLERVGADCVKSVMRGLGPARQSAPFPLEQVAVLCLNEQPLVEQGPVNPRALAVLGAWFLTREIELSLALCKNVTVVNNGGVLAVKWRLPASKTDPMAVAVVRELGCMCQGCSAALCPAHVAEEHFRTLAKLFGPNVPRDLPLFPSLDGQAVAKGL